MDARAEVVPKTSASLPLGDLAPKPAVPAMTLDERLKLTKKPIGVRDSQATAARGGAAQAGPVKPLEPIQH